MSNIQEHFADEFQTHLRQKMGAEVAARLRQWADGDAADIARRGIWRPAAHDESPFSALWGKFRDCGPGGENAPRLVDVVTQCQEDAARACGLIAVVVHTWHNGDEFVATVPGAGTVRRVWDDEGAGTAGTDYDDICERVVVRTKGVTTGGMPPGGGPHWTSDFHWDGVWWITAGAPEF